MKRFIIFLAVFSIYLNAFSLDKEKWLSTLDLGIAFPQGKAKIEQTDDYDFDAKTHGVNFDLKERVINRENGFTFQIGLGIGGCRVEDFYDVGEDERGFDFNAFLGLGYAFAQTEKAIVSLTGGFGYDLSRVSGKVPIVYSNYVYNVDVSAFTMGFFLGADLTATIRISEQVGIYGSFLAGVPVFGFEVLEMSMSSISSSERYSIKAGGYFIKPSLGISIVL